jgi:hypothetical protein
MLADKTDVRSKDCQDAFGSAGGDAKVRDALSTGKGPVVSVKI